MTPAQPANACCELWEIAQSRIELRSFTSCQRALARVLHVFFVVDDLHHPMVLVWTSQDQSKCVQWSHLRSLFFFAACMLLYLVFNSKDIAGERFRKKTLWWTINRVANLAQAMFFGSLGLPSPGGSRRNSRRQIQSDDRPQTGQVFEWPDDPTPMLMTLAWYWHTSY